MINDDYAFTVYNPNSHQGEQRGLTKREWFAGMAMQGLLLRTSSGNPDVVSKIAYQVADAMLKESE